MLPSIFKNDFSFDNPFSGFPDFRKALQMFDSSHTEDFMKTDIREQDDGYVLDMELPGVKKENIQLSLKDGYLNVKTTDEHTSDEKDDKGTIIRKERYFGSMHRAFYVGDSLTEEDIKAKFENGVLTVTVPKKEPAVPEVKKIAIE